MRTSALLRFSFSLLCAAAMACNANNSDTPAPNAEPATPAPTAAPSEAETPTEPNADPAPTPGAEPGEAAENPLEANAQADPEPSEPAPIPEVARRLIGEWSFDTESTLENLPDAMPDEARTGLAGHTSRVTITEVDGRLAIQFNQENQGIAWTQTGSIEIFEHDDEARTVNLIATMTTEGVPDETEIRLRWMLRFVDDDTFAAVDPDMPPGIPSFDSLYTRIP